MRAEDAQGTPTQRHVSPTMQVPVVCVCVQGGPGSIQTVFDALAVGTPALMVLSPLSYTLNTLSHTYQTHPENARKSG